MQQSTDTGSRHPADGASASEPVLVQRLEHSGPRSGFERDALRGLTYTARLVTARADLDRQRPPDIAPLDLSGIACRYWLRPEGQRRIVHLPAISSTFTRR